MLSRFVTAVAACVAVVLLTPLAAEQALGQAAPVHHRPAARTDLRRPTSPPRDTGATVGDLSRFMAANGRAATVRGSLVTKYETALAYTPPCQLEARVTRSSGPVDQAAEVTVEPQVAKLYELSTDVRVEPWAGGQVARIVATSLAGTPVVVVGSLALPRSPRFEIVVADGGTAVRGAALLSRAIEVCGGRSRTPEEAARAEVARRADLEAADLSEFGGVPKDQRQAVLTMCQGRVRAKLHVPSATRFNNDVTWLGDSGTPTLDLLGKIEAPNGLGGSRERSFRCTLDRYGTQYVPKSVSVF